MKTLYKIALAIALTEWTYFIIALFNEFNIESLIIITLLATTGFTCFYIQWKKDYSPSTSNKSNAQYTEMYRDVPKLNEESTAQQ